MIDPFKLENTLDFVQGFIRPVTVVYEQTIEREAAVVGFRGLRKILLPVFVRIEKNRDNLINVMVVKPGGQNDIPLTEATCKMATQYFDQATVERTGEGDDG